MSTKQLTWRRESNSAPVRIELLVLDDLYFTLLSTIVFIINNSNNNNYYVCMHEWCNKKEFTKLNPIGYVPVLVDGDLVLSDSFAILLVRISIYLFLFLIRLSLLL